MGYLTYVEGRRQMPLSGLKALDKEEPHRHWVRFVAEKERVSQAWVLKRVSFMVLIVILGEKLKPMEEGPKEPSTPLLVTYMEREEEQQKGKAHTKCQDIWSSRAPELVTLSLKETYILIIEP